MKLLNRSALVVLAKAPFADWIASLPVDEENPALSLAELREAGNVYLLNEVEQEQDFADQLAARWSMIFENELSAWDEFEDAWPEPRTQAMFESWFDVAEQIMVFDVADDPLLVADLDKL
jgi:hypothetical protein